MVKFILLTSLLSVANCLIEQRSSVRNTKLYSMAETNFNPCWQDLYDDDCSMDTVYQSSFVASEWLKSMPCAAGIEDCDIPEDLKLPGGKHGDDNSDPIDILKALNIKRAKPIHVEKDGKSTP
mmetsp:Transcript_36486/g.88426  ORF Transcript_36486/g.88426 Transcript_36486/m.88426 type:complete len:123 (-) Transcript_36486:180-548(-)